MDGAATHYPILAACAVRTRGPVLELGAGDYSTPLLSLLCKGRKILTLDSDPKWLERFGDLKSDDHSFHLVSDWPGCPLIESRQWGVAFVDNRPHHQRTPLIRRLKDRARFIVIHDTENNALYGYEEVLPEFKYRFDYKRFKQWTTVVSMTRPFEP